jgi:hypothetical protein
MTLRQLGTRFPTFRRNVVTSSSKLKMLKNNRFPTCREASWTLDPWIRGHFFASKRLPSCPALCPRRTKCSRICHVLTHFYRPHIIKLAATVVTSFDFSEWVLLEPPVPSALSSSHLLFLVSLQRSFLHSPDTFFILDLYFTQMLVWSYHPFFLQCAQVIGLYVLFLKTWPNVCTGYRAWIAQSV